jgi:hypothetical protein
MTRLDRSKQLRQRHIRVRTRNQIHAMTFSQLLLGSLGHASHHTNDQTTVFTTLHRLQILQTAYYFLLGIVADRARVQQHGISILQIVRQLIPRHFHHGGYHFAVGRVHLAAVSFDEKLQLHLRITTYFFNFAQNY